LVKLGLGVIGASLLVVAGTAGGLWWAGQPQLTKDHGALP
jgi:hypothetical protein